MEAMYGLTVLCYFPLILYIVESMFSVADYNERRLYCIAAIHHVRSTRAEFSAQMPPGKPKVIVMCRVLNFLSQTFSCDSSTIIC